QRDEAVRLDVDPAGACAEDVGNAGDVDLRGGRVGVGGVDEDVAGAGHQARFAVEAPVAVAPLEVVGAGDRRGVLGVDAQVLAGGRTGVGRVEVEERVALGRVRVRHLDPVQRHVDAADRADPAVLLGGLELDVVGDAGGDRVDGDDPGILRRVEAVVAKVALQVEAVVAGGAGGDLDGPGSARVAVDALHEVHVDPVGV